MKFICIKYFTLANDLHICISLYLPCNDNSKLNRDGKYLMLRVFNFLTKYSLNCLRDFCGKLNSSEITNKQIYVSSRLRVQL